MSEDTFRVMESGTVPTADRITHDRPDYSGENWKSGATWSRRELRDNEVWKSFSLVHSAIPSPYAWVATTLVQNGTSHMIDISTGLAMPYAVPLGYELEIITQRGSWNQNAVGRIYLPTGALILEWYIAQYALYYEETVKMMSTIDFDPTATTAITVDFTVTELNAGTMNGFASLNCILRQINTPPIKDKDVRCKFCGHIEKGVSLDTWRLKCPKCDKITLYTILNKVVKD